MTHRTNGRASTIRQLGLALLLACATPLAAQQAPAPQLAFPGAMGWAAQTPGGRGGKIIRVTTLATDGPGSLREAVDAEGPRIVVFEVGGVIDLGVKALKIKEPFLTIAGQTAPQPGITLIRGGIDLAAHDVSSSTTAGPQAGPASLRWPAPTSIRSAPSAPTTSSSTIVR
ncbi:MAG: hypothetical protein RR969_12650 [Thermomonas sp.]